MTGKQVKYNFRKIKDCDNSYLLGAVYFPRIEIGYTMENERLISGIFVLPCKRKGREFSYRSDSIQKYFTSLIDENISIKKWLKTNWYKIEESLKSNDKKFYKKYLKYRDMNDR